MSILLVATTGGCAMSEEMRRIEEMKAAKERRDKAMTTDLSGEQVFIRSCNTCHPSGRAGMGPELDKLSEHFPRNDKLKAFIRQGVGLMPPQPKDVLNDTELDNLVDYLRVLEKQVIEAKVKEAERERQRAIEKEKREKEKELARKSRRKSRKR